MRKIGQTGQAIDFATLDPRYVNASGDTMSGALVAPTVVRVVELIRTATTVDDLRHALLLAWGVL